MVASQRAASALDRLQLASKRVVAGDHAEARRLCADILQSDPHSAAALHILAGVASAESAFGTAEQFLLQALELEPRNALWLRELGVIRIAADNLPEAIEALSASLSISPRDPSALSLRALALWESGQTERALVAYKKWSATDPSSARSWFGAARCLFKLNRLPEAALAGAQALRFDQNSIPIHELLAEVHYYLHHHDQVLVHRRELVSLLPGDNSELARLAAAHYHLGETNTAVSLFRQALAGRLSPDLHAAFLAVLLHDDQSTAQILLDENKRWARLHAPGPLADPPFVNTPLKRRRLRVAYLCAEPPDSAIFRFLRPLLRNHDRQRIAVRLYCTIPTSVDQVSACVTKAELKDVSNWPEERIAAQMRRDRIDVLVDVSGHYGGGSLLVSACRAAPVQVSCPHYPSTTGIAEMDYILTDRWTCQPGQESQYLEQPYWLDSGYLVFDPIDSMRSPGALPALQAGFVTFGLFQRPAKLNPKAWDAVARVLKSVKRSRLLIHHASAELDSDGSAGRDLILSALASRGIEVQRVSFRGIVPLRQHVRLLSTVDIALDSFPYTGTTTTCDCLWMGVPVVTLAGSTHASRASAGLLLRLGLDTLVASNVDEYVSMAVRTAADLHSLAALRRSLRRRVKESTLVDGARLTRELEDAYRWMLTRMSAGKYIQTAARA